MSSPSYLEPYLQASRRFGGGFGSLLWASPKTQAARFRALLKCANFDGQVIVDAGCGRADFLDFLLAQNIRPKSYIGIEAIEPLATAAEQKRHPISRIIRGDFLENPALLDQGAHTIIFCGSLNTLPKSDFYSTLRSAWELAQESVAFNFLSSLALAKAQHLTWHNIEDVTRFARTLTAHVKVADHYMTGDRTISLSKNKPQPPDTFHSVLLKSPAPGLSPLSR